MITKAEFVRQEIVPTLDGYSEDYDLDMLLDKCLDAGIVIVDQIDGYTWAFSHIDDRHDRCEVERRHLDLYHDRIVPACDKVTIRNASAATEPSQRARVSYNTHEGLSNGVDGVLSVRIPNKVAATLYVFHEVRPGYWASSQTNYALAAKRQAGETRHQYVERCAHLIHDDLCTLVGVLAESEVTR